MEILYYFKEKDVTMDKWQRFHIFDELIKYGCNINVFNPLKYENMDKANEALIKYIKTSSYDLFMTPHNEKDLYIHTLQEVKRKGIATLLICFDSLMTPLAHKNIVEYFDLVMISQQDKNNVFSSYKCNFISSPYAANPNLFYPLDKVNNKHKICFIGTPYGSRKIKLNQLINNGIELDLYANLNNDTSNVDSNKVNKKIDINIVKTSINLARYDIGRKVIIGAVKNKVYGGNPLDVNNPNLNVYDSVDLKTMNRLFNSYDLSLSISEARNTGILKNPIDIVHLRNFEIPMAGGLQICKYFDELNDYFEEDKEILFYRNEEEMKEKIKFYTNPKNYDIVKMMKLAARQRAEAEHTWFCRFKKAFDCLGISYEN